MHEVVIYPGRKGTIWVTGLALLLTALLLVILVRHGHHLSSSDWKLLVAAPVGLFACANRWRNLILGYPRLRITRDYVEGQFGRILWNDVASVSTKFSWSGMSGGRRIVIVLNSDDRIADPAEAYAGGLGVGLDRVRGNRVEIAGGGFDRPLKRVVAELEEASRSRRA